MHELYELKEKLCKELKKYGSKELSAGSLDVVDKLAHAVKNLDKIIMAYEEEDYSSRSYRGSYDDGGMSSRRRDSMGRYSREGRSGNNLGDKLRELMREAPDEHTRSEIERLAEKI